MKNRTGVETGIVLKSLRITLAYSGVFLLVWGLIEGVKDGKLTLPLILLLSQNFIYFISLALLQKGNASDQGNEKEQKTAD